MLIPTYYTIKKTEITPDRRAARFTVILNPNCDIYQGHFPGSPISPGVCNIQMIKECAERLTGHQLFLSYIQQCRLTTLMTPSEHPEAEVNIQLTDATEAGIKLRATIGKETETYLDIKAELTYLKS